MGYELKDASLNPETNNTGTFKLSYQKPSGETATMKGEIKNGKIKELMTFTAEDRRRILQLLQQNEKFQEYNRTLLKEGFNQTQQQFDQISQNHTKIIISYVNGDAERRITADYVNGTVQNVRLEGQEKEGMNFIWLLLIPAVAIGWVLFRKYFWKTGDVVEEVKEIVEEVMDYAAEARKMLKEAEEFFTGGREKDAYERVSQAIRFYFSHHLGLKREITNTELLNYLKRKGLSCHEKIKTCLNLCSLVEFAKYRPNRKDFGKIMSIAEEVVS